MRKQAALQLLLAVTLGCTEADHRVGKVPASAIVDETIAAVTAATPQAPPSRKYGDFGIETAYRIQDLYAEKISGKLGSVAGYKVAFASKAAQQAWQLSEPVTAPLFERQQVEDSGEVGAADFVHFNIEAELAFKIGKPIGRPIETVAELKNYVRSVHVAFDMSDNRFDAKPTAADVIATGAGAHRYLLGRANDPAKLDLDSGLDGLTIRLLKEGKVIYEGPSNAVLGGQWGCLLWTVNELLSRGKKLRAGQVILTGAVDTPYSAKGRRAAGTYVAAAGPLGRITVSLR
ncbi:MAG: 2-keto-4-pentenoate hydratase [Planctomycetota bacterium]|jgi:2-keto-4-pentenoate hydratase